MNYVTNNIHVIIHNYITNNDTIIFGSSFNEKLDCKLLSNYKKIIFSNYKLDVKLFDAYENNDDLERIYSK